MKRIVLIDASWLMYRAFFAIPGDFRTTAGLPTNAVYGFALMFRKLLEGRSPERVAMAFDAPGPTFRELRYPDYKAQRPSMPDELRQQLPLIDELVAVHGVRALRVPGVEADDIIGTLATRAVAAGYEVHIISGDKDFAQLVTPTVRMVDTMREVTYTPDLVSRKWGVKPKQFIDYLALLGDKVDNIPGVPGIGAKGAAALLERFGDLETILASTEELKGRQKKTLEENADLARLSAELATIRTDVEVGVTLDELEPVASDLTATDDFYRRLEFYSLLSAEEDPSRAPEADASLVVTDTKGLGEFLEATAGSAAVALHTVVEPEGWQGRVVGLALAAGEHRVYLPFIETEAGGVLPEPALAILRAWLADPDRGKVAHGVRDQSCALARHGFELEGVVFDTGLASFLIDPSRLLPHRLDQVVRQYLHSALVESKKLTGGGRSRKGFDVLPVGTVATYAGAIAAAVDALWPVLAARLEAEQQTDNMANISLPMARVLARMQLDGVLVDGQDLERMGREFAERKLEVEARIYELAGREFNIGSTRQLGTVLFEELGLPILKKTKTGYSTAADVLERLAKKHEIAGAVLRQRALAKLISTYTEVLKSAVDPADGRVHCTFQQTTGVSGRLITTDPDLQRTPIRTDDGKRIRGAFIARPEWTLISADWSQIELRVLAHVTGDSGLREAFRLDADVHRRTASQIYDVPLDEVSEQQREVGKTVNFATIYGQGATSLGQHLGLSRKEAKKIIDRYFEVYAGVRTWLDETVTRAHERGFVTTLLGRRRYIPELSSKNMRDRAYGERIAANTPIQGSAADLCKLAMLDISRRLAEEQLAARMMLQIHDELLFEAPPGEVDSVMAIVTHAMENAYPLTVPLKVSVGKGRSWAEAH